MSALTPTRVSQLVADLTSDRYDATCGYGNDGNESASEGSDGDVDEAEEFSDTISIESPSNDAGEAFNSTSTQTRRGTASPPEQVYGAAAPVATTPPRSRRGKTGGSGAPTAVDPSADPAAAAVGAAAVVEAAAAADPTGPRLVPTMTCKILVVGNAKCGKTSIVRRFVSGQFDPAYHSTVGADYAKKDLLVPRGGGEDEDDDDVECVRLQLWDIAGQDRFAHLTRAFFRRAKGALVVCDVTREGTFEAVGNWKREIDTWCGVEGINLPVYLLANKLDLLKDVQQGFVAGAKMERTCQEQGFAGWYITSAKQGDNIEAAMMDLTRRILDAEDEAADDADLCLCSGDGDGDYGAFVAADSAAGRSRKGGGVDGGERRRSLEAADQRHADAFQIRQRDFERRAQRQQGCCG